MVNKIPEENQSKEEKQLSKEEQLREEITRTHEAIKSMKQEIKEMKEEMKKTRSEKKRKVRRMKDRSHEKPPFPSRWPFSFLSPPSHPLHPPGKSRPFQGPNSFWTDYISSILNSVAEGIEDAIGSVFIYDKPGRKRKIRKAVHYHPKRRGFRRWGFDIPQEHLEDFYDKTSKILGDLADSSRLRILRALEKGPKPQKELIEEVGVKGGSFKHHMDRLIEQGLVIQETVRGRYLISFKGREALKMAEILYLRSYPVEIDEEKAEETEIDDRTEIEEEDASEAEEYDDEETDKYENYEDYDDYNDNETEPKEKKSIRIEIDEEDNE